jgi:AcrR family transcriptional regulator
LEKNEIQERIAMSPRRKLSEARRTQILQAAVRVISDRGLCDARISDIAREAGASSALVIYYFGTKDRLLAEALTYSEESFYSQTERELSELTTAKERLVRLIEMSCTVGSAGGDGWLEEWVLWLDLWARAPRDPDVARDREALDRRWRDTIAAIVRGGSESGEFRPIDPDDFAVRLGALIDGLAIQVVLGDPSVPATRMFEICMRTSAAELGFEWEGGSPAIPARARKMAGSRRPAPVRMAGGSR